MEVILLERVAKLGQMGEVVRVKDGFARNFLLKRGKALRATADNRAKFDGMKAELEANNLKAKGEATKVAEKIDGRNDGCAEASETVKPFGSVSVRASSPRSKPTRSPSTQPDPALDAPIKTIGKHTISIAVHPEVEVNVSVTVYAAPMKPNALTAAKTSRPARRSGRRRRSARRRRRVLRSGKRAPRRRGAGCREERRGSYAARNAMNQTTIDNPAPSGRVWDFDRLVFHRASRSEPKPVARRLDLVGDAKTRRPPRQRPDGRALDHARTSNARDSGSSRVADERLRRAS